MKARFQKYTLRFKTPSGTSRGLLHTKDTWIIAIMDGSKIGIGECSMFKGLSVDDTPDYEAKLQWACDNIDRDIDWLLDHLLHYPSIQFGIEMALRSLQSANSFDLFPSDFTRNIQSLPINGLVWMGEKSYMSTQIQAKIAQGFRCVKIKIGALDFEEELSLLSQIRKQYDANQIEIRVDANGAFSTTEALDKIKALAKLDIHSIEQPIAKGQIESLKILCVQSPIDIALDEELIGIFSEANKIQLLTQTMPQYIILKPSLIGGYRGTKQWIRHAKNLQIGWWITSALESNIGLNAIAQFVYTLQTEIPQGLGTGNLFWNNFESPLTVQSGRLQYASTTKKWNLSNLDPALFA